MTQATHAHQGPSYYTIFAALAVLTVITVAVSYIDLGETAGVVVAMAIAACKATLVALYFMHLKFEVRSIYIVVGVPLALSVILVLALMPDIAHLGL